VIHIAAIAAAAFLLTFTPSDVMAAAGITDPYESELLRMAGVVLFGQAILVAQMKRRGITDERWRRIAFAGNVAAGLAAFYLGTGLQLFLIISFCMVFAVMLRTLMPVLDHWSAEVRGRHDRRSL
jgi:hypothetical protein